MYLVAIGKQFQKIKSAKTCLVGQFENNITKNYVNLIKMQLGIFFKEFFVGLLKIL